jgi:prepilin-type N-terminal cleavage/methylation domain-containing protein
VRFRFFLRHGPQEILPTVRARVKNRGFTLVEVMMAMAVVVVGMVGLMQAVTIGTEALDTTRKQQVAMRIVESELDRLRGGDWSTIANLPASATITINPAGAISGDTISFALSNFTASAADDNTALSAQAGGFTCSLAATRARPTGASAATVTFMKVVYTVTWKSSSGRSHTRRLETYLGKNGLHLSHQQA